MDRVLREKANIVNYEQDLFFLLSIDCDNTEPINKIIENNTVDYFILLGYLCFNRLAGLAYSNIRKYQYIIPNAQFIFALENMYNAQKIRCELLKDEIRRINEVCIEKSFPFAFLKGSILSTTVYQEGQRASNDIDILINSKDITNLAEAVKELGYIQGEYDINTFQIYRPTRREIIYRRMNWGEAFPLVKVFDRELVKFLEIDINFSISWVPEDGDTVKRMLEETTFYGVNNLQSLSLEDFFIHLLMHLYKELILFTCVKVMRDMEFYKFMDIIFFLKFYSKELNIAILLQKIEKFSLKNAMYTALVYTKVLVAKYERISVLDSLINYLENKGAVIDDVIQEIETNKKFIYCGGLNDRLFDPYRVMHLQEKI